VLLDSCGKKGIRMDRENDRRNFKNNLPRTPGLGVGAALVWPLIGYLIDLLFDLFPYATVLGSVGGLALYFLLADRRKKYQRLGQSLRLALKR
jgi:hypothetical protein